MAIKLTRQQRIEQGLKNLLKEWIANVSIVGLPRVFTSKYKILKVLWASAFLCAILLTGWQIMLSIIDYGNYPTTTNTQIANVNQLPFPVVSFCSIDAPTTYDNYSENALYTSRKISITDVKKATFQSKEVNYERDFENYTDPMFGKCLRFNSGQSMNGKQVPFKTVNSRGVINSLFLQIDSSVNLMIWISNETVSSISKLGTVLQSGFYHSFILKRTILIKQPKPYSGCTYDLTQFDSYGSECYKKTFMANRNDRRRYHYFDCINMCKQRNFGEKCNFQVKDFGSNYFDDMTNWSVTDFTTLISYSVFLSILPSFQKDSSCYETNSNPSEDYLRNCDCPLECETYKYSFKSSSGKSFVNYTEIVMSYDEMEETLIVDQVKMKMFDLLGAMGGMAGLFTGFCVLFLVEIIDFFISAALVIYENRFKEVNDIEEVDPNSYKNIVLEEFLDKPEEER